MAAPRLHLRIHELCVLWPTGHGVRDALSADGLYVVIRIHDQAARTGCLWDSAEDSDNHNHKDDNDDKDKDAASSAIGTASRETVRAADAKSARDTSDVCSRRPETERTAETSSMHWCNVRKRCRSPTEQRMTGSNGGSGHTPCSGTSSSLGDRMAWNELFVFPLWPRAQETPTKVDGNSIHTDACSNIRDANTVRTATSSVHAYDEDRRRCGSPNNDDNRSSPLWSHRGRCDGASTCASHPTVALPTYGRKEKDVPMCDTAGGSDEEVVMVRLELWVSSTYAEYCVGHGGLVLCVLPARHEGQDESTCTETPTQTQESRVTGVGATATTSWPIVMCGRDRQSIVEDRIIPLTSLLGGKQHSDDMHRFGMSNDTNNHSSSSDDRKDMRDAVPRLGIRVRARVYGLPVLSSAHDAQPRRRNESSHARSRERTDSSDAADRVTVPSPRVRHRGHTRTAAYPVHTESTSDRAPTATIDTKHTGGAVQSGTPVTMARAMHSAHALTEAVAAPGRTLLSHQFSSAAAAAAVAAAPVLAVSASGSENDISRACAANTLHYSSSDRNHSAPSYPNYHHTNAGCSNNNSHDSNNTTSRAGNYCAGSEATGYTTMPQANRALPNSIAPQLHAIYSQQQQQQQQQQHALRYDYPPHQHPRYPRYPHHRTVPPDAWPHHNACRNISAAPQTTTLPPPPDYHHATPHAPVPGTPLTWQEEDMPGSTASSSCNPVHTCASLLRPPASRVAAPPTQHTNEQRYALCQSTPFHLRCDAGLFVAPGTAPSSMSSVSPPMRALQPMREDRATWHTHGTHPMLPSMPPHATAALAIAAAAGQSLYTQPDQLATNFSEARMSGSVGDVRDTHTQSSPGMMMQPQQGWGNNAMPPTSTTPSAESMCAQGSYHPSMYGRGRG